MGIRSKTLESNCDSERETIMISNFKKWEHMCLAAVIIFCMSSVCLSALSKGRLDVKPNPKELVNLYKKAVTCWDKSVAMRVEFVHSYEHRGTRKTDIRNWIYDMTHRRDGNRCEWFGRQQFKGEFNGNAMSFNEQFKHMVGDDFFLCYEKRDDKEESNAWMRSDVKEQLFFWQAWEHDGGFLLGRMLGIGSAPKMVDVMSESDSLEIIGQETLSGTSCFILEAKTKYGTFTVWIAPEKGYNALKYIVRKSGRDILRDDIHIEDQGITEWVEVVDSIDVRKIDGVFVPISGKLTGKTKAGDDWERTTHVKVKRSEIVLNPDFKALGAFKISFPEGTEVTHEDIPGLRFRWTKGKFVPDMDEYLFKNLVGKPLPSFDRIMTGFDLEGTTGKMVLVCFFDMNQRPSRNCIMQLSQKAQELKAKDVVVVAVQASKIDENALNEWVKKNNIPFPVGMIQDDEEKTRFAWGVKSLPSLILTNKERIVRAVGFGIGDLDEKLACIHKPITKEEIEKHQREVAEVEIRRLGGEIIVKTSENGSEYTEVKFLGPRYQNEWKGGNLGAKYLNGLCNLKNLRIQDVETFTDEGMVYLEGLNNLESLMLVRTQVTDNGLAHIKELTNLEFLGLLSNRFTDTGLEYIIGMTNLKSLRLDDTEVTNDGLKRLKQNGLLSALEFLSLNRTKISNEGLAHLTGMQNLKRLYLSDTQVTSVGLDYIGGLTKLEGLILNNNDISDEGLLHLKTLTNLNMLYLRNTQITSTGLAHLEKMTNLVQLWIGGTKITDAGLVYLKALNKLESLDLSHTQVTNSGLAHLEGLTSLNELFLKYSGVTIDGYLDLNEALPDCRIYWEQKKDGEVGAAKEKIQSQRTVGSL